MCGDFAAVYFACAVRRRLCAAFFLAGYMACTNDTAVGRTVQRTKTIHDETHPCVGEYLLLFVMSPSSPGDEAA